MHGLVAASESILYDLICHAGSGLWINSLNWSMKDLPQFPCTGANLLSYANHCGQTLPITWKLVVNNVTFTKQIILFIFNIKNYRLWTGRVLPPVIRRSRVQVAVSSYCTGKGKACHWRPSPDPTQSGSSLGTSFFYKKLAKWPTQI